MGKVLNDRMYLLSVLKDKANADVVVCLDADTEPEETFRICEQFNMGKFNGRVKYIRLGEGVNGRYVKREEEESNIAELIIDVDSLDVVNGKNPSPIRFHGEIYDYEPYKDFGELYEAEGKNGIINAMKNAVVYNNGMRL